MTKLDDMTGCAIFQKVYLPLELYKSGVKCGRVYRLLRCAMFRLLRCACVKLFSCKGLGVECIEIHSVWFVCAGVGLVDTLGCAQSEKQGDTLVFRNTGV